MQDERRALWYIKKIQILADLRDDELSELATQASLEEIRRRRVVFLPGDPGGSVLFVASGRVKISRVTRDGKELTLAYRGAGDLFGETCLVDGGPREEMAEAMENSLVIDIPREAFEKVLDNHGRLASRLVRELCSRERAMANKMEDLVFKDVNAKLSELLLKLGDDYGVDDHRGTMVAVKITHQEMANLIGSTRETVSLTLSQFKRNKLIATEGRKIILLDRVGLRALL